MKITTIPSRAAIAATALLLASCMMGPDYKKQDMPVPEAFRGGNGTDSSIADLPWWKVFKNRDMQNLLSDTYANNRDLRSVMANVEKARQYVIVAQAPLFPWASYGGGISKGSNYAMGNPTSMGGATTTPGAFQGGVSWELDLWGKTRRSTEAAVSDYFASEEGQRALMLSLMKQVATGYLSLLQMDDELRILKESVDQYSKALQIFDDQLEGKVGTRLPVSSAQAALAATRSSISSLENEIISLENTLSVLAGRAPGRIQRSGSIGQMASAVHIPAGIPAQILNRRPDIRQSEQQLRAANARIGVAIANYFPSISLTGAGGMVTGDLDKVTGRSGFWGLSADLTGPIFQGGSLRASEKMARQDFLAAKNDYEQTVLSALAEVSTTLTNRSKLSTMIQQQREAVKAYKEATDISLDLFTTGVNNASYLDVLYAMQNQFPAQIRLSQLQRQYASTLVDLYTALGGGWNMTHKEMMNGARKAR